MIDAFSVGVEANHKQDEYARRAARERTHRTLCSVQQQSRPARFSVPPAQGSDAAASPVLPSRLRFSHGRVLDVLLGRAAAYRM